MPAREDKIRPIVWLLCLAPVVVLGLVGAYFLTADSKSSARRAPTSTGDVQTVMPAAAPQSTPVTSLVASAPSARPPAVVSVAAAPSPPPSSSAGALREIDALLARPPDSAQWTMEQKNAYRAHIVDELRARERALEKEVAWAHRSGDTATEQSQTAALDYVRRNREALETQIRGGSPGPDAGS